MTETGAAGGFTLSAADTSGAMVLFVRGIGYRPRRIRLAGPVVGDTILLEPRPILLPALGTSSGGQLCPNRDDPTARALLGAVASHYDPIANDGPRWAIASRRSGRVSEAEVGEWIADPPDSDGVVGIGEGLRSWRDLFIPRFGYAISTHQQPSLDGQFLLWTYPGFESGYGYHFLEPLFAERHTLGFGDPQLGGLEIVFCPRTRNQPEIEGTLLVSDDSSLSGATWHFMVPKDDEHAGGEVTFAPRPPAAVPGLLLTVRGEFWRRANKDHFYQAAWSFGKWVTDTAEIRRERMRPSR